MRLAEIIDRELSDNKTTEGLSSSEAKARLLKDGENVLVAKRKNGPIKIITSQFKDALVIILLICTVVSIFMGEYTEAIAIAIIVLLNAIMGAMQEYKAEKTIEALRNMASPKAKVKRDSKICVIEASKLVKGDIIYVEAGDRVPADAVILEQTQLSADEAMLTGESVPAQKQITQSTDDACESNRVDQLYMGTVVTTGKGKARVIATGMNTQMGKIAGMINEIEEEATPLQKRLEQLGKYIGIGCLIVCGIVSVTGILRGENPFDMLITGVSLAVAAVPEGLPAIVTIALALAVSRMVKKKALVRKLHTVETLGCATVICSDKTGTLTQNKMTVKRLFVADKDIEVTGEGYEKSGEFKFCGNRVNVRRDNAGEMLMHAAVICNNASLLNEEFKGRDRATNIAKGSYEVMGDPTEIALLVMAGKCGVFKKELNQSFEILDEIPFDSTRKMMSVIVKNEVGKKYILTKGAPDVILNRCRYIYNTQIEALDSKKRIAIEHKNEEFAQKALRVLGFAYREIGEDERGDLERELVFLGLTGMVDPPRPEVRNAVRICRTADVKTVMITGDHKTTACAIAKEVDIFRDGDFVLTGAEIDLLNDSQLRSKVATTTVFARVNPEHKLRIVRAFKQRGEIVAMTGDGVNDAPAVKEADIGVSMGISGTDVTKQAADIILLDDNFATLVSAVEEGRVIYANIRKFIRYLLSCNVGEVLTMFLGMLMGMPTVLLPIQILIVNLVTDGLPAIALGLEPAEKDIMKKKPRAQTDSVFSGGLLSKILFRGAIIALTTLAVFTTLYKQSGELDVARTGAFVTLVLTQLLHVFECKSESKNIFTVPYVNNIKLIGSVFVSLAVILAVVYFAPLKMIFSTVSLTASEIITVVLYSLITPVLSGLFGCIMSKYKK